MYYCRNQDFCDRKIDKCPNYDEAIKKFTQLTEHLSSDKLVGKYELNNRLSSSLPSKNAQIKACKTLLWPAAFMGVKLGL